MVLILDLTIVAIELLGSPRIRILIRSLILIWLKELTLGILVLYWYLVHCLVLSFFLSGEDGLAL